MQGEISVSGENALCMQVIIPRVDIDGHKTKDKFG